MWHFSAEFQTGRLRRGHLGEYLEEVRRRVRQAGMMLSEITLTKVLGESFQAEQAACTTVSGVFQVP